MGAGWQGRPPVSSPVVKICGVRRREDALVAAGAGADYVGIVFVPGRRRRIAPAEARIITEALRANGGGGAAPNAPQSVGLFGDQPLAEALDTIAVAELDAVQLCGDESVAYCRQALTLVPVIKVLHIPDNAGDDEIAGVARRIDEYAAAGCMITLDSQVAGLHGGSGQAFDWRIAARLSAGNAYANRPDANRPDAGGRRFLLAGGLTPDNVAAAIAAVQPWGVDVSSGVETGGVKDAAKIRRFIANAKSANIESARAESLPTPKD